MLNVIRPVLLLLVLLVLGCGPGTTAVEAPQQTPEDTIRRNLQTIAETSQVGSEMVVIEQEINKLAETNPEKAAELSAELEKLQGTSGPQATRQAEKMIGML